MFFAEAYQNGKYGMPDRDNPEISSKEKDSKEYNLNIARYVYSEYVRGRSMVTWDAYNNVGEYRAYAMGKQSQAKYEEYFYGKDENDSGLDLDQSRRSRSKAYANLNFSIQSPMPKIMDKLVGGLSKLVNRVSVDPTDKYSGAEKETLKWGAYVDGKYRDKFNALRTLMSIPQQEQGYTPENIEELNLYDAEGGFKLSYASAMEELLKNTFDYSDFEDNILERLIHDITTVGFCAVEDIYEPSTGKVKVGYIDAQYAGVQYTREEGYKRPDFGFYVKMVKMSDLRKRGFKEEDLKGLADKYSKFFGNPQTDDWNKANKENSSLYYGQYDEYVVPVFVVKWIDVEYKNEKQYNNRHGEVRTRDLEDGEKLKKTDKLIKTRMKTLREVHWIIDSEHCYDYGKTEYQVRDGLSEPVVPIHMVKVTGTPIVPRLIPSLDQYMMAWMKLQQGIAMAAMNGYAIEMDAISNLNMGGKKMSPREVLRFWRQTGTLFYKRTDIAGRANVSQARPIDPLQGGAGAVIVESVQMMDIAMKQIEDLTGISYIAMGGSPSPEQGKAVTEYSLLSTNDILLPVVRQLNVLKSNVARNVCLRLQYIVKNKSQAKKAYEDVLGETRLELLRIAEGHDVKYGIRTHARPTDQDIAELKEMIAISLKNGRDGKVGITESDAVRFNNMINSGQSLKRVAMLLHFAHKKAQQEAEAKEMRFQQRNQKNAQVLAQQKAEQEARQTQLETMSNIASETAKAKGSILEKAYEKGDVTYQEVMALLSGLPQPPAEQRTPMTGVPQPSAEDSVAEGELQV